jgi:hypothetical protein
MDEPKRFPLPGEAVPLENLKDVARTADEDYTMLRLRRAPVAPPPIVAPPVNTRVTLLVDGARYGGRVDDVEGGALVIAAPDASLPAERPVIVEWRDTAGVWQLPGEVVASRIHPFPTTSVRPSGPSECVHASSGNAGGIRVAARVVSSGRLPEGTRVPVTTLNLRGERLSLWTILPLEKGDRLECVARLTDSRLVRVACTVKAAEAQSGTWLVRAECAPDDPTDPGSVALLTALVAGEGIVSR